MIALQTPQETHPFLRATVGSVLTASLSAVAGMTDAIGFSQTGEFVSFMSGNSTRMAIAFGTGDAVRAKRLGMVIVLFVVGNALGAIIARLAGSRHGTALLLFVSLALAMAAGLPAVPGLSDTLGLEDLPGMSKLPNLDMTMPALVLMILAMGAINSAVEVVEGVSLGLTYVTGALSKFGRGLGKTIMGDRNFGWMLQATPWIGIVVGAIIGVELDVRFGRHALWLPCGLAFFLMVGSIVIPKDWQRHFI